MGYPGGAGTVTVRRRALAPSRRATVPAIVASGSDPGATPQRHRVRRGCLESLATAPYRHRTPTTRQEAPAPTTGHPRPKARSRSTIAVASAQLLPWLGMMMPDRRGHCGTAHPPPMTRAASSRANVSDWWTIRVVAVHNRIARCAARAMSRKRSGIPTPDVLSVPGCASPYAWRCPSRTSRVLAAFPLVPSLRGHSVTVTGAMARHAILLAGG